MAVISTINAREILDSKGNPTIETTVVLDDGSHAISSCPSGTSAGKHEAIELRDNDMLRFAGKGVLKAVENINGVIQKELKGKNPENQEEIDNLLISLDSTPNKSRLGANSILSVSIACLKSAAGFKKQKLYQHVTQLSNRRLSHPFPKPLCNLINGGLHAGGNLDMQEFIVIPYTADTFREGLEQVVTINNLLRKELTAKGFQPLIGDEGGFAPILETNEGALGLLTSIIKDNGLDSGKVVLGIDVASSSFYKDNMYRIKDHKSALSGTELGNFYKDLVSRYHILYLEDPFAEDDFESWQAFTPQAPDGVIVTGDDLTVTNPDRLKLAVEKNMIRGIIIKPNQIGTVTESIRVVNIAKEANIKIIVSHRSGETNDDFIADFAIGVGADFAKFGAPVRGERVAKYNRLLQIESELQNL